MKLLCVITTILSCGTASAAVPMTIDSPFRKYAQDFVKRSHGTVRNRDLANTAISFHEQEFSMELGGVIGMCYYNFGGPTRIEIDPRWWSRADEKERWALIYHELGHCVCNLDHPEIVDSWFINWLHRQGVKTVHQIPDPYLVDGCERTLMHPYILNSSCVAKHEAYYRTELFMRCHVIDPGALYLIRLPPPPKKLRCEMKS